MLLAGFAAVLLPLGLLLGLQYRWLVDLEEKTAIAEKVYLWNYLEGLTGKVEQFYRVEAEKALNIPPYAFREADPQMAVRYFGKRKPRGAKLLFAVNFLHEEWDDIVVYDPVTEISGQPADVEMARAISIALAPWRAASEKGSPIQAERMLVEEKDPANRILLNPITDEKGWVLGVAGMVIDSAFFARLVLPAAIDNSFPEERTDLRLAVHDEKGKLIYGYNTESEIDRSFEVSGRIPFIFSDWRLSVGNLGQTPEEWARSNFAINVTMSAVLAVCCSAG